MRFPTWTGRALGAALLAGSLGACDFIESTTSDPNQIPEANLDQLFVAAQVNSYHITESQTARLASLWTQQTSGINNQFAAREVYNFDEEEGNGLWSSIYAAGGVIDIRRAIAQAEEQGRRPYAGILKIHEAYFVGTAADTWGDVPYTQAGDGNTFPEPQLDDQMAVYAAIQTLLDQAIADLGASTVGTSGPGVVDFNLRGGENAAAQFARWTRVARTLKARYYMHVAEVQGASAYQAAYDQAVQGVTSNAYNWVAVHSTSATEQNLWYQFDRERQDHIVAGDFLVDLMNNNTPGVLTDDDPRLSIYFETARGSFAGQYAGSAPGAAAGDPETDASHLNTDDGPASADFNLPIVSCTENAGIAAEAAYRLNRITDARNWYNAMIACQENFWGVSLAGRVPNVGALTGTPLLTAIMTQKYIGLFLNPEIWNDWKRTCLPNFPTAVAGESAPGRFFYPQNERQSNTNIPDVSAQPFRNDNDLKNTGCLGNAGQ